MKTTPAKAAANRQNASLSTGPRTAGGKRRASKNAHRHGLRAAEIVTPLESVKEWKAHRWAVVDDLDPVGYLEQCLADRVAVELWRLRRAERAEAAIAAKRLELVRHLALDDPGDPWQMKLNEEDAELQAESGGDEAGALFILGSPWSDPDRAVSPEEADLVALSLFDGSADEVFHAPGPAGWTAGKLREAVGKVTREDGDSTDALRLAEEKSAKIAKDTRDLRRRLAEYRLEKGETNIPDTDSLERLSRYQSAIERSLYRALHELERLQARRAGRSVPPPLALDVTLSPGPGEAPSREPV